MSSRTDAAGTGPADGADAHRRAMSADSFGPSTLAGLVLALCLLPVRLLQFPGRPGHIMAVADVGIAVVFGSGFLALRVPGARSVLHRHAHEFSLLLGLVGGVEPVTVLMVSGQAWTSSGIMIMVVVVGAQLHSRTYALLFGAALMGAWGVVAARNGFVEPWPRLILNLVDCAVLAGALNIMRVRTADRLFAAQASIAHLAVSDELTGLANRRGFLLAGRPLLEAARRSCSPVSVLSLDVDGLKRVNDVAGHAAGDRLLRGTAATLQDELRAGEVLARLGGDEFAVLLPSAAAAAAERVVDRLERALARHDISASMGVAEVDVLAAGESLEAALDRADAAMYDVKRARGARGPVVRRIPGHRSRPAAEPAPLPRVAAESAAAADLGMISTAAVLLFCLLVPAHLLLTPNGGAAMASACGLSAGVFAVVRLLLLLRPTARWAKLRADWLQSLILLVVCVDALIELPVVGDAWPTNGVVLAILAAAALLQSRRHAALVVSVTLAAWLALAVAGGFGELWRHLGVQLPTALVLGVVLHVTQARTVARLAAAHEQLGRLAVTDELTGLLNRRGFLQAGTATLSQAGRTTGACVLYLDVDGLKQVNDTLGHAAGDRLLVAAATATRQTVRPSDLVGRLGGDEFVVLAPQCPMEEAGRLVDRLHAALAENGVGVSVSVGIAAASGGALEDLIDRADAGMYASKLRRRAGRAGAAAEPSMRPYGTEPQPVPGARGGGGSPNPEEMQGAGRAP